jgi:hypothetical protein
MAAPFICFNTSSLEILSVDNQKAFSCGLMAATELLAMWHPLPSFSGTPHLGQFGAATEFCEDL